jgi:hypothetical protein
MVYSPKYTSQTKVQGLTQFAAGSTSKPTVTEVLQWIQEVEADADERSLYTYAVTDEVMDIPGKLDYPAKNTLAWVEALAGFAYSEVSNKILMPPRTPIVSVTALSRRTTSLTETPVWELLTEGPSSTGSFMLLKRRTKTNQYLAFAIFFYQNEPDAGLGRVKMTYNYGWNLGVDIIGEWCTLKVAIKVLDVLVRTNTPYGSSDYGLTDLRIGLDLKKSIATITDRISELELEYFPVQKLAFSFI